MCVPFTAADLRNGVALMKSKCRHEKNIQIFHNILYKIQDIHKKEV